MDELARRYLLLCLRLERIVPGFVDSYNGPSPLAEAAAAEPAPLAGELHDEAVRLRAMASDLGRDDPRSVRRARWMDGQLRAIAALARRAGGEEIAYLDFVEQLYGVPIQPTPEAELQAARDRLDAALPGHGSLVERLEQHRSGLRIPADSMLAVLQASAARFRRATLRDFELPRDEGIDWEEAHDQPWGAYATFIGEGRTRILVNVDLPFHVPSIAYLAAHEAYPGHHAEHAVKEKSLVGEGVAEAHMRTMNTPEAMIAEGQADVAREVVMSDRELTAELAEIGRDAQIRADWSLAMQVHSAEQQLSGAQVNAALMLHHDGRPEGEVRAWVQRYMPLDEIRIDHLFRTLHDPVGRTYPFTYTQGARLIRAWLQVTGQTVGFARLLSEQLSPAQLLAELQAASA